MDEKILIVDDTPVIRQFLIDVMTDLGFAVHTAENGRLGLDLVIQNDYALIICDVHMPVMNGLQTVLEIKKIKPEIPIIMTDSFPDKEAEEAAQAGAIRCLTKPFDLMDLKSTVDNIIKRKEIPTR